MVTCSLQTFPLMGTWSRFHQQFKRGFMSYGSHIFLGWASSEFQKVGLILKLDRKLCANAENVTEEVTKAPPEPPVQAHFSHVCLHGPGTRASVLLYRQQVISFSLLSSLQKSYQLISGWQKTSCLWTVPEFWQQCSTTRLKKRNMGICRLSYNTL